MSDCANCGHDIADHWGGSTPEKPIVGECMWEEDFEDWRMCLCDAFRAKYEDDMAASE